MNPRRIAVLTGCRSDYGLLRPLLRELTAAEDCELEVYAAAGHLAPSRGMTIELVEADGFAPRRIAPLDDGDDAPAAMAELAGRVTRELAILWRRERPEMLVVLGDRVEVLAAATAAWYSRVPLAQLQAGDLSRVDDGPRHAVSRLAHLLFPATAAARRRLLDWGEDPRRVHLTGSLALDHARACRELNPNETAALSRRLGLELGEPFLLLVYHPLPGEIVATRRGLDACLEGCRRTAEEYGLGCLALHPNADAGGRDVIERLRRWTARDPRRALTANLPPQEFVGLLRRCACLVGNSSAGLIEASVLGVPAVNVGERQQGRERGVNVFDVPADAEAIESLLREVLGDTSLRARLSEAPSPYGDGAAAPRIRRILCEVALDDDLLAKTLVEKGP